MTRGTNRFASNLVWINVGGLVLLGALLAFHSTERAFGAAIGMWLAATLLSATGMLLRMERSEEPA